MKPWVEGSGTDDVDVTLKEAVKTYSADALRPEISTVIWSPEIVKVRPGKVLEIKDMPVKAGSVKRRITGLPIRTRIEGPRPSDPARLVDDLSRAKALLGQRPTMSDLNTIHSRFKRRDQPSEISNSVGSVSTGNCTFNGVSTSPRLTQGPKQLNCGRREPGVVIVCVDVLFDSTLLDLFANIDPRLQIGRTIDNGGVPRRGQLLDVLTIAKPSDV